MILRRKVLIGTLGAAAAAATAATAGCSSPKKASAGGGSVATEEVAATATPTAAPVQLTVTPATGADEVSPAKPVVVTVADGTLGTVTVTAGKTKIDGEVQADGSWRSTEKLAYGKKYKVSVTATDSLGAPTTQTTTFTTLKPDHIAEVTFQANAMASLKTGKAYGAGQPVIVAFSHPVNKAAAEKAIEITTSPSVEGKFYWPSSTVVHWRPAKYWTRGTTVKVKVNAFGVKLGKGVYGEKDTSTHFRVDRQLIAISDNRTHMTKVYIDGKLVRSMKSSLGRGGGTTGKNGESISFWTAGGPHVVLSKERYHTMSSASYGVEDKDDPNYYVSDNVEYCTRITYSGEFLHAAPWNGSLGRANLSHGCVNLSMADAKWVYENFVLGDVVDVTHSPRKLSIWNGIGDWTVSFDKYGR